MHVHTTQMYRVRALSPDSWKQNHTYSYKSDEPEVVFETQETQVIPESQDTCVKILSSST